MYKKIIILTILLVTSVLYAEPVLNLKQIEAEMKTVKERARFMELLKLLGDTQPRIEEDIVVLGRLMDRFPNEGRKAIVNVKDPKLVKPVIKECKRKIALCEKYMKKYPSEEMRNKLPRDKTEEITNAFMNAGVLMGVLGALNNKEALPFLRQYLKTDKDTESMGDDSFYGTLRYWASETIDQIDEEIPLPELVKKLDVPNITRDDKAKIIKQISLSKDSQKKKALKELSIEHKDKDVRSRCATTLRELIATNPEESDMEFIYQRLQDSAFNGGDFELQALKVYVSRNAKPLGKKYMPILIDVVTKGKNSSNRAKAAEILGVYKVDESIACLEACAKEDQTDFVRTACKQSYLKLIGDKK